MIILNIVGDTIQAQGGTNNAITITAYGIETASSTDTYKKLGQSQIQSASAETLYTVPASTSTVLSVLVIANTTSSDATISVWHVPNGGSAGDDNAIIKTITVPANKSLFWNKGNVSSMPPATGGGGTGDVAGPSSSTDNAITRFDGTTGKLVQNSSVLIDDSGNITGVTSMIISDGATLVYGGNGATMRQRLGLEIGVNVQAFDADLAAVAAMTTDGIVARTASATFLPRTLTGTTNQVNISNGDGVAGNPVFSLPQSIGVSSVVTFAGMTLGTLNGVIHGVSGALSASPVLLGSEVSGVLPLANGGLGATVAPTARDNLGLGVSSFATFAGMTLGVLNGPLRGISGLIGVTLISLTADVSGALPIANGGTGTTTSILAFNSLSPVTTRGDLITRDATNNVRLAVGSTFTVLRSNGVDPSWGKVDPTTDLSGIIPVANSGTGATTAVTAFNNLSPVTTRGDIIVRDATNNARLAIGATNTVLRSNGVDPSYGKVALNTDVSSVLGITNGGTGSSLIFTPGSVMFAGTSGVISQDTAGLFFDAANNRLALGTTSPIYMFHMKSSITTNGQPADLGGLIITDSQVTPRVFGFFMGGAGDVVCGSVSDSPFVFAVNSLIQCFFNNDGNTWIGRNQLAGAGVPPTATLHVGDITGTGDTIMLIQAGPSQANSIFEILQYDTSTSVSIDHTGHTIFNEQGNDVDFRVEGDTDANLLFIEGSTNRIGIGTNGPTTKLDVNSDRVRIRTSKTPSSASDGGTQGDICWDSNYIYVCVAGNTWKRVAIATW